MKLASNTRTFPFIPHLFVEIGSFLLRHIRQVKKGKKPQDAQKAHVHFGHLVVSSRASGNAIPLCATMFCCAHRKNAEWALTPVKAMWLNPHFCVTSARR